MKHFCRVILPHISISLTLALVVLVILNWYNPMLGFLSGGLFTVFFALCVAANLLTAWTLYILSRHIRISAEIHRERFREESKHRESYET